MLIDELKKKYIMILPGRDLEGHRVVYKYLKNFKQTTNIEEVYLFIFGKVCKQLDYTGESTFTVLFDISCIYKLDFYCFKQLADLLKKNFKNRLHKLYIYPCGMLGQLAFWGIRKFLGPLTVKKIVLVTNKQQLESYFDNSVIPLHLGGTCNVLNKPRKFI